MAAPQPSDLLTPHGRLNAAVLWPGLRPRAKVEEKLQAFIGQGWARSVAIANETDKTESATQWAYYRSYQEVYERMLAEESSYSDADEASGSKLWSQIEAMGQLAQDALAAHEALVTSVAPGAPTSPVTRESRSSPIRFTF